jgi:CRP-like cAMP-binding protein
MPMKPDPARKPTPIDKSQIVQDLLHKIKVTAQAGNFEDAERFLDELTETDPMAITEAIKAANLIEEEMAASVDKDHLALWPDLYNLLSVEERICFYHSTKKYTLPANQILLKFGSLNNRLFFIEKGKVAVGLPMKDNKLKVLAQLGRGDVLGEYTFATISLCSATAVTKTEVEIRCMEGKKAENWVEKHPGLYDKLIDYCLKCGKIDQIEKRKESQERSYPRHSVEGKVNATLVDTNGQRTTLTFRGDVEEISRSGTSFSIHSNKKAVVKKLLTRSLLLEFTCTKNGKPIHFSILGKVIRVSFLLYNDYLLHIGFHDLIPKEIISELQT